MAGPIAAIAGIALLIGGIKKLLGAGKKAGDVMSPADGKTQISTKEGGLFELSTNDDVAAGPGILNKLKGGGLLGGLGGMMKGLFSFITNPLGSIKGIFESLIETINTKVDQVVELFSNNRQPLEVMVVGGKVDTVTPFSPSLNSKTEPLPETIDTKEKENSISLLENKLEDIRKLLAGKQTFAININNKMKYDAFEDYNTSSVNGKEQQAAINDSSFL